jgi:hypothetical protein
MEKGKLLVTAIECCRMEAHRVLNGGAEVCHSDCDAVDDAQILGDDQPGVPKPKSPHSPASCQNSLEEALAQTYVVKMEGKG